MSKGFRNPLKRSSSTSPKAAIAAASGTVHISITYDRAADTAHLLVTDGECTIGEIAKVLLMLRDNAVAEVVRQTAEAASAAAPVKGV